MHDNQNELRIYSQFSNFTILTIPHSRLFKRQIWNKFFNLCCFFCVKCTTTKSIVVMSTDFVLSWAFPIVKTRGIFESFFECFQSFNNMLHFDSFSAIKKKRFEWLSYLSSMSIEELKAVKHESIKCFETRHQEKKRNWTRNSCKTDIRDENSRPRRKMENENIFIWKKK